MTETEIEKALKRLKKVSGVTEAGCVVAAFRLVRTAADGHTQEVHVEVFDYGTSSAPAARYQAYAQADDGAYAAANPDASIIDTLDHVHWEHLDAEPEQN